MDIININQLECDITYYVMLQLYYY